jgi:hypothetical protein
MENSMGVEGLENMKRMKLPKFSRIGIVLPGIQKAEATCLENKDAARGGNGKDRRAGQGSVLKTTDSAAATGAHHALGRLR